MELDDKEEEDEEEERRIPSLCSNQHNHLFSFVFLCFNS